jgi:hypothetical protein
MLFFLFETGLLFLYRLFFSELREVPVKECRQSSKAGTAAFYTNFLCSGREQKASFIIALRMRFFTT